MDEIGHPRKVEANEVDGQVRNQAVPQNPGSSGQPTPRISVVIPTRARPQLVLRAVASALRQSFAEIEVIVVVDGRDTETEEAILGLADDRLRLLLLEQNVGGSEARNHGIRSAQASWIALLDDDDEWRPEKLSIQWSAAQTSASSSTIVACRFVERTEEAERVLPLRMPAPEEDISEYLFCRRGWQSGEGFLQTSTWLVSRELLLRVPFTAGLKRCQDLDWLLHAKSSTETRLLVVPEVLAIFHHEEHGERVSRSTEWEFLYQWALSNRSYFTRRAFSFFIATFCVPSAAKQEVGADVFRFLLKECLLRGEATMKCLLLFAACWLLSEHRRRSFRAQVDVVRAALARRKVVAL